MIQETKVSIVVDVFTVLKGILILDDVLLCC